MPNYFSFSPLESAKPEYLRQKVRRKSAGGFSEPQSMSLCALPGLPA